MKRLLLKLADYIYGYYGKRFPISFGSVLVSDGTAYKVQEIDKEEFRMTVYCTEICRKGEGR